MTVAEIVAALRGTEDYIDQCLAALRDLGAEVEGLRHTARQRLADMMLAEKAAEEYRVRAEAAETALTAARALIPTWREWEANIDARGTAGPSDYGECAAMLAAALGATEEQR